MGIKHAFASGKADGGDATIVRPSNWNADHTIDGDVAFNGHDITTSGSTFTVTTSGMSPAVTLGESTQAGHETHGLYVAYADPGSHEGAQVRTVYIQATPVGSTAQLPQNSDLALNVFLQKQNWDDPDTAVDGDCVAGGFGIQNGGPDAVVNPTQRSDTDALLLSADMTGRAGGCAMMEGFSRYWDGASPSTLLDSIYTAFGFIDPVTTTPNTLSWGYVALKEAGSSGIGAAFCAANNGGNWPFAYMVGSVTDPEFTIGMDGVLTWNNGTLFMYDDTTGRLFVQKNDNTSSGPILTLYHNTTSPAISDEVGRITFTSNDISSGTQGYGQIRGFILDTTAGAEYGQISISPMVNGATTAAADFSNGVVCGAATGGMKGIGTINLAGDIYKNNTAYANPDYVLEHWATGKIERFKYNDGADEYTGLRPLCELAEYMRENFCLPGFSDEPMGAFERADKALEKIEELAVYIVELHERIEALERRMAV